MSSRSLLAEDLLEACQGAVNRVLAQLPDRDRQVLEGRRAEVIEATHRETRAALEDLVETLEPVA